MQKLGMFACGLVLIAASWAILDHLGQGPLEIYDEGTYAKVVEESIARGDFMSFTLWGNWWFEKPPLYFWLAGLATQLTGDVTLGIRLPAALFGIAVVAMTMALAYSAARQYWVAALAGVLLLSIAPFVEGAREARLDLLASFFILLALYAAFYRKYLLFGAAVGMAVLAKGIIAIFAAAALPTVSLWRWEFVWLRDRSFWLGALLGAGIVLPWHMWEWYLWGNEFWRQYVGHHVLARYESNLFGSPELQTDYLARLGEQAGWLIWALSLAAGSAVVWVWKLPHTQRVWIGSAASLLAAMIFVFFTAQTRALSYLLPLYPLAALCIALCAWYVHNAIRKA